MSRGLSLTKTTLSMGAELAIHAVSSTFKDKEGKTASMKNMLSSQMATLSKELGELKGSVMKAGQMLSMYGEYFLPPEANQFLRELQSQSPALDWPVIEKSLIQELGQEKINTLEIETDPIGTASLGQVHRARIKGTNTFISLKVQYPGVAKAVDSDLSALKRMLSLSKLVPKDMATDALFAEVRSMLQQEVDYTIESKLTKQFRQIVSSDSRYGVPQVYDEYSTARVLATSFEVGVPVLSEDVLSLPQQRRNKLGIAITELYLREVFELGLVQTDPHFGNYLVRIDPIGENDTLILLDFGATKKYSDTFMIPYREMVRGSILQDRNRVINACQTMGFLAPDDSAELVSHFVELCYEICEPFFLVGQPWANTKLMDNEGNYDWALSDLPTRLAKKGTQVAFASKFRAPPQEVLFLDRKMTGLFIFLQKLKVKFNGRTLVAPYL